MEDVDINQTDEDGDTPLMHAAMIGNLPCLQYLLAHDADPNIQNNVCISDSISSLFLFLRMKVQLYLKQQGVVMLNVFVL